MCSAGDIRISYEVVESGKHKFTVIGEQGESGLIKEKVFNSKGDKLCILLQGEYDAETAIRSQIPNKDYTKNLCRFGFFLVNITGVALSWNRLLRTKRLLTRFGVTAAGASVLATVVPITVAYGHALVKNRES